MLVLFLSGVANARFINLGKYEQGEEKVYYVNEANIKSVYYQENKCVIEYVDGASKKLFLPIKEIASINGYGLIVL